MLIPRHLHTWLLHRAWSIQNSRPPDFIISGPEGEYLRRWYAIPRNPFFNIYVHEFLHSDEERALHDHMYINMSLVLQQGYREHFKNRVVHRPIGAIAWRLPATAHRVELIDGKPAVTIFIAGPRVRRWGFHCPHGWVYWKDFVQQAGKGCE